MRSQISFVLTVLFAMSVSPCVRADFELVIHGNGSGGTPDPGTIGFPYTQTLVGSDAGLLSEFGSGDGNGHHEAETIVEVVGGSSFDSFANMLGYAANERAFNSVPFGKGSAVLLWEDVVTLSGSAPLPASIQLHFQVAGLASSELTADSNQAQTFNLFSARGTSDPTDFQGTLNPSLYAVSPLFNDQFSDTKTSYLLGRAPGGVDPTTQNWDSFTTNGDTFAGQFSVDVELEASLNAYDWAVLFSAFSSTLGGSARTEISTLSLIDVTDATGNALDGFVVDFDSGRTIGPPTELGDYDIDGDVDGADFLRWQRGESDDPLSSADLQLWQSTYGIGAAANAAASRAVPEPTAWLLALSGAVLLISKRL